MCGFLPNTNFYCPKIAQSLKCQVPPKSNIEWSPSISRFHDFYTAGATKMTILSILRAGSLRVGIHRIGLELWSMTLLTLCNFRTFSQICLALIGAYQWSFLLIDLMDKTLCFNSYANMVTNRIIRIMKEEYQLLCPDFQGGICL